MNTFSQDEAAMKKKADLSLRPCPAALAATRGCLRLYVDPVLELRA